MVERVAGDDLLARRPRAGCAAGSWSASTSASASASGRSGATSRPVVPSRSTSADPPTAVATTGTAHAIASSSAIGIPSVRDGSTATSAARTYGATSATGPGRVITSATPAARAASRSRARSAPSPSIHSRADGSCATTRGHAATSTSTPFSRDSRPV